MLAAIFVIPLVTLGATAHAQQQLEPTLLELARRQGGLLGFTNACGPTVRLEDMVSTAHLIVYGTVVAVEARLTDEGRHVVADHHVQPFITVYGRVTPAPGVQRTPVFTARGGTLVVEGLTISEIVEHNSKSVMLNVGDEVVVIGTLEKQMLTLSPAGLFRVVDGVVKANGTVEGFTDEGPGVPLDQFIARVQSLTARD